MMRAEMVPQKLSLGANLGRQNGAKSDFGDFMKPLLSPRRGLIFYDLGRPKCYFGEVRNVMSETEGKNWRCKLKWSPEPTSGGTFWGAKMTPKVRPAIL